MFLQVSVILSTGGHAWLLQEGHVWLLLGVCMVAPRGGVHDCSGGACMAAPRGACVVALGGHAWLLLGGHAWVLPGGAVRGI